MSRRGAVVLAVVWAALVAPARAAPPSLYVYPPTPPLHLYEGRVVVTGTDLRSRPAGIAACLRDVLVQVSGDPGLLADPRALALGRNAAGLVAGFDYVDRMSGMRHNDEQGSSDRPYYLTVRFDPARLDAALHVLGDAPYTGPRPVLLPVVTVHDAAGQVFVLTAEGFHLLGQPEAFAAAADRYRIAVRLPTAAALTDGTLAATEELLPITGTLDWSDAAHGWVTRWQAEWNGRSATWGARGVSFDEAFRVAVRGALGLVAGHVPASLAP